MKLFKSINSLLNHLSKRISEENLIVFNCRSLLFLIFISLCFTMGVILKLNTSSSGIWWKIIGENNNSTIVGSSKAIRSDEWLVSTPFYLTQSHNSFSVENKNIGGNTDPLMMNLPVKNWSLILRPQHWGILFFDNDRSFSFYWLFKYFALTVSLFLLFMLVTKNNFMLSVIGVFWILFSSFTQWWYSTNLVEMISYSTFALVSGYYLLFSKRKSFIFFSAVGFVIGFFNFVIYFYPAFQVPLAWLHVSIFTGLLLERSGQLKEAIRTNFRFRLSLVASAASIMALSLTAYIKDALPTIKAVMSSVYPGKRIANGGQSQIELLSGYFSSFYTQENISKSKILGNICEASNYLVTAPIIFMAAITSYLKGKRINPLLVALGVYLMIIMIWVLVPFPAWLSKILLLSYSPPKRAFLGLGLGSIILTIAYFSDSKKYLDKKLSTLYTLITTLGFTLYLTFFIKITGYEFGYPIAIYIVLLFLGFSYAIFRKNILIFTVCLSLLLVPNIKVNPIERGLGMFENTRLENVITKINEPGTIWLVYGDQLLSAYFKAVGANVVNGVNYTPNKEILSFLDPNDLYSYITNRYAHIRYMGDSTQDLFTLNQDDLYTVNISPCDPRIKKIGVNRIAITGGDFSPDVSCLKEITTEKAQQNIKFYEFK